MTCRARFRMDGLSMGIAVLRAGSDELDDPDCHLTLSVKPALDILCRPLDEH